MRAAGSLISSHASCSGRWNAAVAARAPVPGRRSLTRKRLDWAVRASPQVQEAWGRIALLKRKLEVATSEENYSLCAQLRDERKALIESLPPVAQYLHSQAALLRTGNVYERLQAIRAMAEAGDDVVLPDLAETLRDPELRDPAQAAMWAIFTSHHDPAVGELMAEGCRLMGDPESHERALAVFTDMVARAPTFAEAYNKRATLLYMMRRYEPSIADCKEVLRLQPLHFGAASGMGLCHLMLGQEAEAAAAFERALAVNPGLDNIDRVLKEIKKRSSTSMGSGSSSSPPPGAEA